MVRTRWFGPIGILILAACGGDDSGAVSSTAVIDTLPGGVVRVVNPEGGVWGDDPARQWALEEDLRIGALEGEEVYMFGSAVGVIPDGLGRIWALDYQAYELRRYGADGRHQLTVGGRGEGPGELSGNICATRGAPGEIWVETRNSLARFDTAGTFLGTVPTPTNIGCSRRSWTTDGRFLTIWSVSTGPHPFDDRESYFVAHRFDPEEGLVPVDTLPTPELAEGVTVEYRTDFGGVITLGARPPLVPRPTYGVDPDGNYWITDGDGSYSFRNVTPDGDTLLLVERPHTPAPVPSSARGAAIEDFMERDLDFVGGFDPEVVPRVYPPFEWFTFGPDGSLWLTKQVDEDRYGLDLFRPDGTFLGEVRVPESFHAMTIHAITEDAVYGVLRDELDVPYVVRMRIVRPEG